MQYVKLNEDGSIQKYPYTLDDLFREYPNTSFPIPISEESLNNRLVFTVQDTPAPSCNFDKNVVEVDPVLVNGVWVKSWSEVSLTSEQLQEKQEKEAASARATRNELLTSSDWTQLSDAPINKQAWASYRQNLRDITSQPEFPWNIIWPNTP